MPWMAGDTPPTRIYASTPVESVRPPDGPRPTAKSFRQFMSEPHKAGAGADAMAYASSSSSSSSRGPTTSAATAAASMLARTKQLTSGKAQSISQSSVSCVLEQHAMSILTRGAGSANAASTREGTVSQTELPPVMASGAPPPQAAKQRPSPFGQAAVATGAGVGGCGLASMVQYASTPPKAPKHPPISDIPEEDLLDMLPVSSAPQGVWHGLSEGRAPCAPQAEAARPRTYTGISSFPPLSVAGADGTDLEGWKLPHAAEPFGEELQERAAHPSGVTAKGTQRLRKLVAQSRSKGEVKAPSGITQRVVDEDEEEDVGCEDKGQTWQERAVQELLETAEDGRWRVVVAGGGCPDAVLGGGKDGGPLATVVVAGVAHAAGAHELVRRQQPEPEAESGRAASRLLVVALVPAADDASDNDIIMQAQSDLCRAGADDVILIQGCGNLRLALEMSLARAKMHRRTIQSLETKLIDECERMLAKRTKEIEAQQRGEPTDGLFWQCAHRLFRGFPQLDWDIDDAPVVGSTVVNRRLDKKVGRGGFGTVYAATNLGTGAREAVKVVDKEKLTEIKDVTGAWREIALLKGFDHPNIVGVHEAFQGPGHLFISLEYAGNTNMAKAISAGCGRLCGDTPRTFLAQVLSALSHIHGHDVAHRDVKPENIAVAPDGLAVKMLDFGSAVPLTEPCTDMAGTMPFMSPEMLDAGDSEPYIPSGGDIWATGVMVLEMLCGCGKLNKMLRWPSRPQPMRERATDLRMYFEDFEAMYAALVQDLGVVPGALMDMLVGMFQLDEAHRITAAKAEQCEWVSGQSS